MRVLAVDVAILLPDDFQDAAIRLNRALRDVPDAPIALNTSDCLPHVSLAMGCVREDEVSAVATLIETIAASHARVKLLPAGFHVRQSQTGYVVASLELERTASIQSLHEAMMRALAPYVGCDAMSEMFVAPESISASTLRWVNEYRSAASFDRFWPHITLGMGALPDDAPLPAATLASRVALSHLGPHCTCRRVLFETSLRQD